VKLEITDLQNEEKEIIKKVDEIDNKKSQIK